MFLTNNQFRVVYHWKKYFHIIFIFCLLRNRTTVELLVKVLCEFASHFSQRNSKKVPKGQSKVRVITLMISAPTEFLQCRMLFGEVQLSSVFFTLKDVSRVFSRISNSPEIHYTDASWLYSLWNWANNICRFLVSILSLLLYQKKSNLYQEIYQKLARKSKATRYSKAWNARLPYNCIWRLWVS